MGAAAEPAPSARRGSAESFRALAARLARPLPKLPETHLEEPVAPVLEPEQVAEPWPERLSDPPPPAEALPSDGEETWPASGAHPEPDQPGQTNADETGIVAASPKAWPLAIERPAQDVLPVPNVAREEPPEHDLMVSGAGAMDAEAASVIDPAVVLAATDPLGPSTADLPEDPEIAPMAPPQPATNADVHEPVVEAVSEPPPAIPALPKPTSIVDEAAEAPSPADLAATLAARFGGSVSILKRRRAGDDPFAVADPPAAVAALASAGIGVPDPQTGELARSLLDIMSGPSSTSQPQERALAADTLLRLAPRIPLKALVAVVERLCMMEAPPVLLVARLIRDPRPEVAGPLLEKGGIISDQDLLGVMEERNEDKNRMIARRRMVSPALADALVAGGEPSVLLTLVRNPGAALSHDAFHRLCECAKTQPALQAPLATRADTPAPVAFELFWTLPAELRRLVLSRFLTDSENLNRILKIALSVAEADAPAVPSEQRGFDGDAADRLVALLAEGNVGEAARLIAASGVACEENVVRIVGDPEGEPLIVLFKVIGLSRARFAEAVELLRTSPSSALRESRNNTELQSIFDTLSFNKARVLLTYWDWAIRKSGPYAALAA